MLDRHPARYVAPLALAGAVAAIVLVVNRTQPAPKAGGTTATTATTTTTTVRTPHHRPRHKYYHVKSGDLLSTIARRYGMSTQAILELNPNLDPQTLQTGQRIRLR
jgi:LysM repeat protein